MNDIGFREITDGIKSEIEWKDIEDKINTYPMVTITLEEDKKLRITKNITGDPKKRYEEAGIIVTHLDKPPKDFFKN